MITPGKRSVLDQYMAPFVDALTPEVAQKILDTRISAQLQSQLDVLAQKANEGLLSEEERMDYEEALDALDVLATIKANAREALKRSH
jgi:hypothetical protein